jgi:hypothetical protein
MQLIMAVASFSNQGIGEPVRINLLQGKSDQVVIEVE